MNRSNSQKDCQEKMNLKTVGGKKKIVIRLHIWEFKNQGLYPYIGHKLFILYTEMYNFTSSFLSVFSLYTKHSKSKKQMKNFCILQEFYLRHRFLFRELTDLNHPSASVFCFMTLQI